MTLREFYDKLISIKYHSRIKIEKDLGKKYTRAYFNRLPDLSLKDAKVMYDFLNFYRWDFNGSYIVIHYPEISVNDRHIIKDLYFAFNPIHIKYFAFKAARSTYSLMELNVRYLHSHISGGEMLEGFTSSICFGSTVFRDTENTVNDFINFLLYLDVYLRHEHYYNPYNTINSVYAPFSLDFNERLKVPLDLFDYKIGYLNQIKMVIPIYTEEADKFFTDALGNTIKVMSFNGREIKIKHETLFLANQITGQTLKNNISDSTILDKGKHYNFLFQNQPVTFKITNDELSEKKTSEDFKKYICEAIAPAATNYFLEAYNKFEQKSTESLELHLQQD